MFLARKVEFKLLRWIKMSTTWWVVSSSPLQCPNTRGQRAGEQGRNEVSLNCSFQTAQSSAKEPQQEEIPNTMKNTGTCRVSGLCLRERLSNTTALRVQTFISNKSP